MVVERGVVAFCHRHKIPCTDSDQYRNDFLPDLHDIHIYVCRAGETLVALTVKISALAHKSTKAHSGAAVGVQISKYHSLQQAT